MHKDVVAGVLALVLERAEPHISFFKHIGFQVGGDQNPDANVEFAVQQKHRPFEIFLN